MLNNALNNKLKLYGLSAAISYAFLAIGSGKALLSNISTFIIPLMLFNVSDFFVNYYDIKDPDLKKHKWTFDPAIVPMIIPIGLPLLSKITSLLPI